LQNVCVYQMLLRPTGVIIWVETFAKAVT
jgi:hypothetical protein